MSIKRRLTADTKIISRKDPALVCAGSDAAIEYGRTLDIEKLGDRKEWALTPSVFTVKPLMPEYEHYAYDISGSDFWRIFAAHVRDVTELDFTIEREDGKIAAHHRGDFPPEVVMDIATAVIQLANKNDSTFFGLGGDYLATLRNAALATAAKTAAMVGAKNRKPSTENSPSTADTPPNSESK